MRGTLPASSSVPGDKGPGTLCRRDMLEMRDRAVVQFRERRPQPWLCGCCSRELAAIQAEISPCLRAAPFVPQRPTRGRYSIVCFFSGQKGISRGVLDFSIPRKKRIGE
ncbi:hypothetical protein MRX96_018546 [Rhipicephalus microplus]